MDQHFFLRYYYIWWKYCTGEVYKLYQRSRGKLIVFQSFKLTKKLNILVRNFFGADLSWGVGAASFQGNRHPKGILLNLFV